MKHTTLTLTILFLSCTLMAGKVDKVYTFSGYQVQQQGVHQIITLDNTMPAGLAGEPMLPYHQIALMLPPGEKAIGIEIRGEELTPIPGTFELYPQQEMRPVSEGPDGRFIKKQEVYQSDASYPASPKGNLMTQYLNGYSFALSTFTPVIYNPARKAVSYYKKVTVSIQTQPDQASEEALKNLTASPDALKRVRLFAQNPDMIAEYPVKSMQKSGYQILIITPSQFQSGFQDLINYYAGKGRSAQVITTESIIAGPGSQDLQSKIRDHIIQEYQTNGIDHVILGGDVGLVPYRGMYCYVISGSGYEDYDIPADIYYSGLDGNWNTNGDNKWGEPGEDDLLPEVSVGRISFNTTAELANIVHKSVSYQGNPVPGESKRPFLVSEHLYDNPETWGSDYLELLVGDHNDNGYFTYGIPAASNTITRLYDTLISQPNNIYTWTLGKLLEEINSGKSFIHHSGHSNWDYMMRLSPGLITNENFYNVNGIDHNYQLMYTHGCICGAFDHDPDCIAELCVSISNFLVGGVFNSRYGWFDQGTTEGPSAHLHREFISALYNPDPNLAIAELGSAHTMSKIKSAPWVGLPGEFEPGAQRWCHYDCNVLGDPALKVWIVNPVVGIDEKPAALSLAISPNPATDRVTVSYTTSASGAARIMILDAAGRMVGFRQIQPQPAGRYNYSFDLSGIAPGIYTCRLVHVDGVMSKQVVVVK